MNFFHFLQSEHPPQERRCLFLSVKFWLLAIFLGLCSVQAMAQDRPYIRYDGIGRDDKGYFLKMHYFYYNHKGSDKWLSWSKLYVNGTQVVSTSTPEEAHLQNNAHLYMTCYEGFESDNSDYRDGDDNYSHADPKIYIPSRYLGTTITLSWDSNGYTAGTEYISLSNYPYPKDLRAVNENGRIKLTWNTSEGHAAMFPTEHYNVQLKESTASSWHDVVLSSGNVNYENSSSKTMYLYFPDELKPKTSNTTYNIRVKRAGHSWNNSSIAPTTSITLPPYPYPTNLKASLDKTTGLISLSWNFSGNYYERFPTEGYNVQWYDEARRVWHDIQCVGDINYPTNSTSDNLRMVFPKINQTSTGNVNWKIRLKRNFHSWQDGGCTAVTTISLPPYPQPQSLQAQANPLKGIIALSWNMPASNNDSPNSGYLLQYSEDGNSWNNVTIMPGFNLNFTAGETSKKVEIDYPVKNKGVKNLQFRIMRAGWNGLPPENIGLSDWNMAVKNWTSEGNYNGTTSVVSKTSLQGLNTNPMQITGIAGESDINGIKISWTQDNGQLDGSWYFRLYRKDTNQGSFDFMKDFVKEIKASDLASPEMFDDLLTKSCTPYNYIVRLENGAQGTTDIKAVSPMMDNKDVVRLPSVKGSIESLSVSKGYYNDRVDLKWVVTSGHTFTRFTVQRSEYGVTGAVSQTVYEVLPYSVATTDYRYTDNIAIPGVYYTYDVIAWVDCNGTSTEGSKLSSIGFIQPFGIVSGKVTFEGGNAVQGVSIIAQNDASSQYANRSLEFNSSMGTGITIKGNDKLLSPNEFTWQAWINSASIADAGQYQLFDAKGCYGIIQTTEGMIFNYYDKNGETHSELFAYPEKPNEWHQLSFSWDLSNDKQIATIKFYIDAKLIESRKLDNSNTGFAEYLAAGGGFDQVQEALYVGMQNSEEHHFFNGYMDELRIFKAVLDSATIANTYDSYLTGKENNLALYYRFDEPIPNEVFDISGKNGVFNENHGVINNFTGSGVPPKRNLDIVPPVYNKAVTDANGNYLITTIPYTGEGSSVTLQPALGVHEFNPSNKPLFFNQQSSTYNNVDFTDISSFRVTGYVYFENSNYPVEGATLKVDGSAAVRDGAAITTDENGYYEINVPIGKHYISVEKTGHTFVSSGRFPAYKAGLLQQETYNFNDSISGINFADNTKVTIAGRVVGGNIESEKPLGFGLSKANIGAATISFKNDKSSVIFGAKDTTATTLGGSSTTSIAQGNGTGTTITVTSDPATGEFLAIVPPIPLTVVKAQTNGFGSLSREDFSYSTSSFDIDPNKTTTLQHKDALGTVLDSLVINDSLRIIRYNEPVLSVRDLAAAPGAFGDSTYIYSSSTETETIKLYSVNEEDKSIQYHFGYPIFSQKTMVYDWEFRVYETYENKDNLSAIVLDTVPLSGLTISIDNALSSQQVEVDTTASTNSTDYIYTLSSNQGFVTLDSTGVARYSFDAGFPNIVGDKLLTATASFVINGKTYEWLPNNGEAFKAYMLGEMPSKGSNFVTMGPDVVDIVLHDPAGSNSYAYLEKGSTFTKTEEHTYDALVTEEFSATAHLGPKFATQNGFFTTYITLEQKLIADLTGVAGGSQGWTRGNRKTTTLSFNENISTSSNPDYVGSMADVYIGTSSNITFGQVRKLAIFPDGENEDDGSPIGGDKNGFSMFTKETVSADQQFKTIFSYTQDYVINTQIPNIKALRNDLIEYVTEMPTAEQINFGDKKRMYYSTLPKTSEDFGKAETYKVFYAPSISADEKVDEVSAYNLYISSWEKKIAANEQYKLDLFGKRLLAESNQMMNNRSFDAGIVVSESMTAEYEGVTIGGSTDNWFGSFSESGGYTINEVGGEETFTVGRDNTDTDSNEDAQASSITFGYELSDGDSAGSDALTIDIYKPIEDSMKDAVLPNAKLNSLHGYIFQTRAGQTTCPYEGGDSTVYYRKDGKPVMLNYATFQTEKPEMYIDGNKNSVQSNVPSSKEATYTLQLQNLSESQQEVTYQLSVADGSNPNGLILSIDGTPLTSPRSYTIPYGEELTKTLKVRQGSTDILDYTGLELVLGSVCDGNISTSATIEAHFIPSSTEAKLTAANTMVNISGGESASSDTTATFVIAEYDRNFRNFADLQLQYKNAKTTVWTTAHSWSYYYDSDGDKTADASYSDLKGDTIKEASITYTYSMKDRPDGTYNFRIVSRSKFGTEFVPAYSNEVTVIKDVTTPKLFGTPSPTGGILTAEGEISVTFNEEIQPGLIMDDLTPYSNITVQAVKNGAEVKHDAALKFTGGAPAATEANIPLANKSFTLEAYFNRPTGSAGTLLAHGSDLAIGFDGNDNVVVNIGEETFVSEQKVGTDEWNYLTFSYNNAGNYFEMYDYYGATTQHLSFGKGNQTAVAAAYAGTGRLYVGAKADKSEPFTGEVHELSLWSKAQNGETDNHQHATKVGNEQNLLGYWTLAEGHGTVAEDKARSRHLIVPAKNMWYSSVNNYAASLNGANYVEIDATQLGIQAQDNFAVEFWFYGGAQTGEAALFSCGDGMLDYDNNKKLSIGFNAAGTLVLKTNGVENVLSENNYLDNTWHHFALNVLRTGSNIVYVDGEAVKQLSASSIENMLGSKILLGARNYRTDTMDMYGTTGNYFTGAIDEVRVWRASLTAEAIKQTVYNQLSGNESGLVAYYPFNEQGYDKDFPSILTTVSTLANKSAAAQTLDSLATLVGGAELSQAQAPVIKPVRLLENVAHTFTANGTKIILNITENPSAIENTTLEISVRNVLDLNGNPSENIRWTAFVNKNRLNWSDNNVELTKEFLETKQFTVEISNQSGQAENWSISNLPSWLSASALSGTLQPLTARTLTFTVASSVPVGSYDETMYLTGSQMYNEPLALSLKVIGEKPDWAVNPADFDNSMSLIAQLQFEGKTSADSEDLIAAFVDGVCVGVASPEYYSRYDASFVTMDIYGNNNMSGKTVLFKAWNASSGEIYPLVNISTPITFAENTLKGSMQNPVICNAETATEQQISLNKGWNWISLNARPDDMSVSNVLAGIQDKALLFKGSNSFAVPNGSEWAGTLSTAAIGKMYKVNMSQAATLTVIGDKINPATETIAIVPQWNWIGYIPTFSLPVAEALADMTAQEGDLIKGQSQFAVYTDGEWIGSLKTMAPGKGYYYMSNATGNASFEYPSVASASLRAGEGNLAATQWTPVADNVYSGTMSVIAVVMNGDTQLSNAEVAFFAGEECRGAIAADAQGRLFVSVAGDDAASLSIQVYDAASGETYECEQTLAFQDNDIIGSMAQPYIISIDKKSSVQSNAAAQQISMYPNPVKDYIVVESGEQTVENVEIIDMSGRLLKSFSTTGLPLPVQELATGTYLLRISTDTLTKTFKFTKE
jgi:hypothetical protein